MTISEQRARAVELMKSRTRKNSYTQGSKRGYFFGYPSNKVGDTSTKGYSDCSSSVAACIKAASGISIGGNTSAQVANRSKGLIVDESETGYPDESKLLPGDALYFKGNSSHTLSVGHVEMYTGSNECYGHGSGTGPNKHDLKAYCKSRNTNKKRYFMAIRWIIGEDEPDTPVENGVTVTGASVNIRALPSTDSSVIKVAHKGDVLRKIAEVDGWTLVVVDGVIRCISSKYIK